MKKLLLVFAHPEDRSFVATETAHHYALLGWDVCSIDAVQLGHPEGSLDRLTPGTLEDPLYQKMEDELPDVVITFDATGINNHPDHVKTCYAATYAFQRYAAWLAIAEKQASIRTTHSALWFKRLEQMIAKRVEPKLYYACVPKSMIRHAVKNLSIPRESHGAPWKGTPDDHVTTVIGREYFILRMEGTMEHFMGKNDRVSDRL